MNIRPLLLGLPLLLTGCSSMSNFSWSSLSPFNWFGSSLEVGAKGVGELGISGAGAAVVNAIHNATGVRVRALDLDLDTGTAAGRMVVNVMSALAEYERQLLIERTNEGLAHARAQGRHGGRRRVLTDQQVTAIEAAAGTISNADLAAMHGVSLRTISRVRSGTYTPE